MLARDSVTEAGLVPPDVLIEGHTGAGLDPEGPLGQVSLRPVHVIDVLIVIEREVQTPDSQVLGEACVPRVFSLVILITIVKIEQLITISVLGDIFGQSGVGLNTRISV